MHALLASLRSRWALVAPYDILGEVRRPNLPGTVDQYPNRRLPLPVTPEELYADPWCGPSSTSCGRTAR